MVRPLFSLRLARRVLRTLLRVARFTAAAFHKLSGTPPTGGVTVSAARSVRRSREPSAFSPVPLEDEARRRLTQ